MLSDVSVTADQVLLKVSSYSWLCALVDVLIIAVDVLAARDRCTIVTCRCDDGVGNLHVSAQTPHPEGPAAVKQACRPPG